MPNLVNRPLVPASGVQTPGKVIALAGLSPEEVRILSTRNRYHLLESVLAEPLVKTHAVAVKKDENRLDSREQAGQQRENER
jgi:hypothetical protein